MEKDKVQEYVEGKVTDALNKVVTDAYLAGYNAGYQDGYNKVVKDSVSEGSEFVDLGLPSGTLWSSDYVKDGDEVLFLPYPEAQKYDIPTKEQVDELREYCEISIKYDEDDNYVHIVLGPNGNSIVFKGHGYKTFAELKDTKTAYFWQVYNSDKPKAVFVPYPSAPYINAVYLFPGYKIPIWTVKNKKLSSNPQPIGFSGILLAN